jgi:hypothetical protein
MAVEALPVPLMPELVVPVCEGSRKYDEPLWGVTIANSGDTPPRLTVISRVPAAPFPVYVTMSKTMPAAPDRSIRFHTEKAVCGTLAALWRGVCDVTVPAANVTTPDETAASSRLARSPVCPIPLK